VRKSIFGLIVALTSLPAIDAYAQSAEFAVSINDMGLGEAIYVNDMGLGDAWYLVGACPNAARAKQIYVNDMGLGKAVYVNRMGLGKSFCISNPEYLNELDEGLRKIFLGE